MDTLDSVKADAKDILLEMKRIGEAGPTRENAAKMIDKMHELKRVSDRLD